MEHAAYYLNEIVSIKSHVRKNKEQLLFYQNFWNMDFCRVNIKDYIFKMKNRECAKEIINSVMNGPYYYDCALTEDVIINPKVDKDCFGNMLLGICLNDGQDKIISLREEKDLCSQCYKMLKNNGRAASIQNLIGYETINEYFENKITFKTIGDVFDRMEADFKNVIILEEAKKSAKKHDFRNCYGDVYNGISALIAVELPLIIEGKSDEVRKKKFLETCKLEISRESEETLNIERYRKEREFVIPKLGKVLFEWHIKVDGSNTRIHYYIDKKKRKIYIGHCGRHLGTAGYKS